MITIKDVAELAGVSKSTVSNVINKTGNVKESTRNRVLLAIEALNFIPSSNAKNLRAARSNEIGIVLPDVDDSIHRDILNGICSVMQRAGYFVNIALSHGNVHQEQEKLHMLLGKQIDGLLLLSCQDQTSEAFRHFSLQTSVPTYYILRRPQDISCNFAGFHSRKIVYDITRQMLSLGYRHIALACGSETYTSENEAISGFMAAYDDFGLYCPGDNICQTLMTKEDAFKVTVSRFRYDIPEAVIATSGVIAKGILETVYLLSGKVGEDITVVALGDEGWCLANQTRGILTTNSNAVKLGEQTAEALLQIIRSRQDTRSGSILIEDTFDTALIPPRPDRKRLIRLIKSTRTLNILTAPLQSAEALDILSGYFEAAHPNTKILMRSAARSEELLQELTEEAASGKCRHDLYLCDCRQLPFIAGRELLKNLDSYVSSAEKNISLMLPDYLSRCRINGRYFGIPLVVACQLLFYRRDLFGSPELRKQYQKRYGIKLHLPRTWVEFNRICEFFTQACNPSSPVPFGVSVNYSSPDSLLTLLQPYMQNAGGSLTTSSGLPALSDPSFRKGLECFLQTLSFAEPTGARTPEDSPLDSLIHGRCAMAVTSSDLAASLHSLLKFDERYHFAMLPGNTSVFSGWCLGISNYTPNLETAYIYLNWISSPEVSQYLAILTGQSPTTPPYHNNELQRLYPWMELLQYSSSVREKVPAAEKLPALPAVPPGKAGSIIANIISDVMQYGSRLPDSIRKAARAAAHLAGEYGISRPAL